MAQAPGDDQQLLRQLARGNQAAFNAFYERFQPPIFRFAWHMSGNQTIAEEVTQEVFLRLIDKPGNYDPTKGPLSAYLFGIARNVLREQFLVQTSDLPLDDELIESESSGATDEADLLCEFERKEKLEHLQKCILALPEEYREALVFCELEEMSYAEAAAALGCQPGTVASRLHRARAMLKSRMKKVGCLQ